MGHEFDDKYAGNGLGLVSIFDACHIGELNAKPIKQLA